ncbi:LysM peptidoglycan-binding domain-containing protein [Desemzia sp. FAM 23991]|uniref:LysM peptidoglycan-binding domain-containing protein n=1 Tax=Desemzia sp. FAM 23991 TaxID=3259521 RepID=UPI003885578B
MITRKERISLLEEERTIHKMKLSNARLKRGTALFSTSLLVGLLAFPTYTETVKATELDKDQAEANEVEKDIEVAEGETVAVESETSGVTQDNLNDALSEEKEIEKEQKINEFKQLVSQEIFDAITFETLSLEDVDQLVDNALLTADANQTSAEESADGEASEDLVDEESTEVAVETNTEDPAEEQASEIQPETPEAVEETEEAVEVIETETPEAELAEVDSVPEEVSETEEQAATEDIIVEIEEGKTEAEIPEDSVVEENTKSEETVSDEKAASEEAPKEQEKEQVVEAEVQAEVPKARIMVATTSATVVKETTAEKKIHVVKSGDTLNKIASTYGVSVNDLIGWNNITNKNVIKVGQQIYINQQAPKQKQLENISTAQTAEQFIATVGSFASEVAAKNNLYASVMIAQAGLESGWGSSSLSKAPNNNLFGIKGSYNGESVTMYTKEYSTATGWVNIPQNFKKYPSYAESFQDNANLLKNGTSWNSNYYSGAWVSNTSNVYEATAWLEGRYATDPTYAAKLNNLIKLYNLIRFDVASPGSGNTGDTGSTPSTPVMPTPSENENTNPETGTTSQYTIQSGDTLTSIAKKYNTSVASLKSMNNLKSDTIYVGQKLTVNGSAQGGSTPSTGTTTPNTGTSTGQYTIQSGDTLSGIARKYSTTVASLKSLNNLKTDTIYVGQKLTVNGAAQGGSTPSTGTTTTPNTGTSTGQYTIQSGDTLSGIARKYSTTVASLKSLNNLKSDTIYVGQKLTVNGAVKEESKPTTGTTTNTGTSTGQYTIQSGDTLSGIARKYSTTVASLKSLNNLKTDTIYVGQKLTVNGAAQGGSTPSTGTTTTPNTGTSTGQYTIQSGDTLSGIARKYSTTVASLKSLNNLKTDTIYVGQKLTVNGAVKEESKPTTGTTTNTGTSTGQYTIQSGDTLSGIARKYSTTVASLKSLNNLKTDTIYVGQKLSVNSTTNTTAPKQDTTVTNLDAVYTVKSGDTLTGIGNKYSVSIADLKSWNSLNSDAIYVGQKLAVKVGSSSTPTNSSTSSASKKHTIASGDTLSGLALTFNISVAQLKEWNNLTSDLIFVGQQLAIK